MAFKVEILAEAGINHQNDIDIARELISAAKDAGADAVKFQASTVIEEVSFKAAPDHFADLGKLVPTWSFLRECKAFCDLTGIEFICTPAGPESLAFVLSLGVKRIKVASDNLTNVPFLREVARADMPVILSTGMGLLSEVRDALSILPAETTVLHCVSAYPAPGDQMNLNALYNMQQLGRPLGLSDHTTGLLAPLLAVAAGVVMIEKHLTLDRTMPGPDHAASLEPMMFQDMVTSVRGAEAMMGNGIKSPQPAEKANMALYRKSIVATRSIRAGERLAPGMLEVKRPGTGIPASRWWEVIGTLAKRDYEPDELID